MIQASPRERTRKATKPQSRRLVNGCHPLRLRSFSLELMTARTATNSGTTSAAGGITGYGPKSHSMMQSLHPKKKTPQASGHHDNKK